MQAFGMRFLRLGSGRSRTAAGVREETRLDAMRRRLADVIIRVLDYCAYAGIDIENVLEVKHEYNKSRPYRHGGKKC